MFKKKKIQSQLHHFPFISWGGAGIKCEGRVNYKKEIHCIDPWIGLHEASPKLSLCNNFQLTTRGPTVCLCAHNCCNLSVSIGGAIQFCLIPVHVMCESLHTPFLLLLELQSAWWQVVVPYLKMSTHSVWIVHVMWVMYTIHGFNCTFPWVTKHLKVAM